MNRTLKVTALAAALMAALVGMWFGLQWIVASGYTHEIMVVGFWIWLVAACLFVADTCVRKEQR